MTWDQNRLTSKGQRLGICIAVIATTIEKLSCIIALFENIHWQFLLQGGNGIWRQSGLFYMAPSLTLGGCLLVNLIFHFGRPTYMV